MSGLSRRDILRATAGAALSLPLVHMGSAAPQRPLRFAAIGCKGKGESNRKMAAEHGEVTVLCDPDLERRMSSLADHPNAALYSDYRRVIEERADDFDAVLVSTPDHHHGLAAAMAMMAGKHVYCEKPLTRTIGEARRLHQIARKTGVATQMGNQGTALDGTRMASSFVQDGGLGRVHTVHCWTDRAKGWWGQGIPYPEAVKSPEILDWHCWLGPTPYQPYGQGYHPFAWRGWWNFGTGALGDMGCHILNLPFHALKLNPPLAVTAEVDAPSRESYPLVSQVHFEFENGIDLHWYDGGLKPPVPEGMTELPGNGTLIVGENDTLFCDDPYGTNVSLLSGRSMDAPFQKSPGHFDEWIEAIRGGERAGSDIVRSGSRLTEMVLVGNLALWVPGERVTWNRHSGTSPSHPHLDMLVHPDRRRGWEMP